MMEVVTFDMLINDPGILERIKPKKIAFIGRKMYKNLFKDYLLGAIDDSTFIGMLNALTGGYKEENKALLEIARYCYKTGATPVIIDIDIDEVLAKVKEKLYISDEYKIKILQDARLWYLAREGPYARIYHAFSAPFFWLPEHIRHRVAKFLISIYAVFANLIPGDQFDVTVAVSLADEEIAEEIAEKAVKNKVDLLVVPPQFYYEVSAKVLELKDTE